MPPQVAEGAPQPQLPKVGAPTPGGAPGAGPKVGNALAARMAMLQLDPTKMNPQAVADHQKIMREKEMARMEAELKAANDRRDEEMERIGRKKSVGQPVMKPGEAAPGQLVHAKKPKMAGRGKKNAPVRKIKFENKEQERPNVLREIQGDEMLFVQDLVAIIEKFQKPILNRTPGKFGIPPDQWDALKRINVMKSFHERITNGPLQQQRVGDSFRENKEELLEKHKDFQQHFVQSLRVFHALRNSPMFANLLTQLGAGHPPLKVPTAFSKPLGRFREYRQLLERLLNCTNETNEEGLANKEYGLLKDALAWVKAADRGCYADFQQAEDAARMLEVQHSEIKLPTLPRDFTFFQMGRRIIRTDEILPKGSHEPLKVYLCNDVVMWFSPQGQYKGHAPLRDITLANEDEVTRRLNEEDRTDDAKGEIRLNIRTSAKTSGKCVFNPYPLVEEEEDEKEEVKEVEPTPKRADPPREEKKDPEPAAAPAEPAKKVAPTAANTAMAGAGAMAAAAMAAKKQGTGGATSSTKPGETKTPPGPPAGGPKPTTEPAKPGDAKPAETKPADAKPAEETKKAPQAPAKPAEAKTEAKPAETTKPEPKAPPRPPEKPAEKQPTADERPSTELTTLAKSSSQVGNLPKSQSGVGDAEPDKASVESPAAERASSGAAAPPRKHKGPSFNPTPIVTTAPAAVTVEVKEEPKKEEPKKEEPKPEEPAPPPSEPAATETRRESLPTRKSTTGEAAPPPRKSTSSEEAPPPLPAEGPPAPPPPPPPPPSPAETAAPGKEVALVWQCLTIRLEDKWCKAFIRAKQAYLKAPCPDTDEDQAKFDANVRTMVSQASGCCAIS